MGGLIVGIFWGTFVAAMMLAALSLSNPLPPRSTGVQEVSATVVPVEAAEAAAEATATELVDTDPQTADQSPDAVPDPTPGTNADGAAAGGAGENTPAEAIGDDPDAETAEDEGAEQSQPATQVPLPSGSEFNRPPPEPEAALPAPDAAPSSNAPQAPALAGNASAPSIDTSTAAQPLVGVDAPAQIAAVSGEVTAPASPALAPAPSISGGPTALTQPEASDAPQVRTTLLPQAVSDPATDEGPVGAEAVGAETVAVTDPEPIIPPLAAPVFPSIGEDAQIGGENAASAPDLPDDVAQAPALATPGAAIEEVAAMPSPARPQTNGLPQVTGAMEAEAETETEETLLEDDIALITVGDLPAIQAFAADFDASDARPLMAVVLIDDPESQIDLSTLTRFTFPVAFAVDPLHPEGAERAEAYRDAGFEVVILGTMIADGATAVDTEVALMAAVAELPEAVAVIDTPEGRIQGDRPVLDAMVTALADSGHGLVAFPRGLNAAEQSASRAGIPGATVFRYLDGEDERATVITRVLSRAAFAAAQEGTVIVVGRTRPDTVTALFSWALGSRSEAVALAPLSATMLRAASE